MVSEQPAISSEVVKDPVAQRLAGGETRAHKADGTLVMEFKRTMLIPKRGHSIDDQILVKSQPT